MTKKPLRINVVNVRLPEDIISWIDSLVKAKVYNSRSEAIREFSREYVLRQRGASE
ncbi:ribbon-helix-helix protein, CopG family [Candidatus Woesearchaeota archaeon]|nr:ribbon-helix-helix protein, CopG family [Candidatus Woesearchaeota archaeon]